MKRWKLMVIVMPMLLLTGCIQENSITDEQSDVVAERMAGMLLESDEDYEQELISLEELTEDNLTEAVVTPTPSLTGTPGETTSGTSGNGENDVNEQYTLTEVIGEEKFDVNYSSFKITDTYPEDSDSAYFVLNPRVGYQLLVVSFTIKNITNSEQALNLSEESISYQLDINSGTVYSPLLTLLENDLQYMDVKFSSGNSKKGLLIFEVSNGTEISSVILDVTKNDKSTTIKIK